MEERRDSEKRVMLVWITNPEAAARIVSVGHRLSSESGRSLIVVSIQNPINGNWEATMQDLAKLNDAAAQADGELTVVYSDNRLEAAVKIIQNTSPEAMIAGVPGNFEKNIFLDHLRAFYPDIPIYTVDTEGNTARLV